jgi:hypothetical protein
MTHRHCWECNRKFRGNHKSVVETENGLVAVHKACAARLERDGLLIKVNQ